MSIAAGVVIPASGSGRRMGGARKPFLILAGRTLIEHTLEPFLRSPFVMRVAVAVPNDVLIDPPEFLTALAPRVILVEGGTERGDSVRSGIEALDLTLDIILIHDAARPFVSDEVIQRCIAAAAEGRSVVAAVPVTDTIKEVDEGGRVTGTPDRRVLYAAQTPQAFPAQVIRDAYARALQDRINATDDAALVARYGGNVTIVAGSPENIKITSPADLSMAEVILAERTR